MTDLVPVKESTSKLWFYLIILFLFIEYIRPQDFLPISAFRPALLMALILTCLLFTNQFWSRTNEKQIRYIWAFIVLLITLVPFAVNNYWAYQTVIIMLVMMPFILSVAIVVDNIDRLKRLVDIFICMVTYIAIYSLLYGGIGSGNFLADENDVSLLFVTWIPVIYFIFANEKSKLKKVLYFVVLVINVAAVVNTSSRGGFVGLFVAGASIWLVSDRKIISLMVVLIAAMLFVTLSDEQYLAEMSTVTDTEEGTANARLQSWASGWDMFADNPLGVGGNNFAFRFSEYQGDRFERDMGGRVSHSIWFTLLPELGIIGTFIFFKLIHFNFKDLFRIKNIRVGESNEDLVYLRALAIGFMGGIPAFFAAATFISVLYYPHFWYLTAFIVALARIHKKVLEDNNKSFPGAVLEDRKTTNVF